MEVNTRLAPFALALILAVPTLSWAIPSVPTQHNDNARTGANLSETILTPAAVSGGHFGKLFTRTLAANVDGQVLYVPHLTVNGAMHNVIFAYVAAVTPNSNGTPCGVYAFDADYPHASAPLWHTTLTPSAQWTTAAPVIDTATNTLYALTKDNDDSGDTKLRAFSLLTGKEKPGSPVVLSGSVLGTGDANVNGVVSFDTSQANCRPGLLFLNGIVYAAFAHASDTTPYHGWVFGYRYAAGQFTQTALFCTTPNGGDGGIWQAGKGLAADTTGHIYGITGNGTFDADGAGGKDYGTSFLKLNAADLSVADSFTPFNQQSLDAQDLDLGSCGALLLPGTTRLFGGGTKDGSVYLLDTTHLGGFIAGGPDNVVQEINNVTGTDKVGQNPVCWNAGTYEYVYLWAKKSGLQVLRYDPTVSQFSPAGVYAQTTNTSGGSLCVTANGSTGGIVWAVGSDAVFHAYKANAVTQELWNSSQNAARDGLGSVGHFQFPTVVNGKAYVPTGKGTIVVYGLLP